MTQLRAVKLHFQSPLHLSKGQLEMESSFEVLHSDTLKSAIFACGLQLYPEISEEEGNENKVEINLAFLESFRISSAFPFCQDEYFFPKPNMRLANSEEQENDIKERKRLKNLKFLGQSYFEQLIHGENMNILDNHLLHNGKFATTKLNKEKQIFKKEIQQRVTIPPFGSENIDPTPFYLERIYFAEGAGLFVLIESDEKTYKIILNILKLLGDHGVGTDRHVGNGHFEIEEAKNFSLNIPETPNKQMALSLYCPKWGDLDENILSGSSYQLTRRGGYIASTPKQEYLSYLKKWVYMFTEGSIFPSAELEGNIVDLSPVEVLKERNLAPIHPIWRDGRALFVDMKIG